MDLSHLSVVIPLALEEEEWPGLIEQLQGNLTDQVEVIFVEPQGKTKIQSESLPWARRIRASQGRASQLNAGGAAASRDWIWFLHADSRFDSSTLDALRRTLRSGQKQNIYYFDLQFLDDGPWMTFLNAYWARFRSQRLGMPFGDQGLLVSAQLFRRSGGFPEDAPYGEDHLFVWEARLRGAKIKNTGGTLFTSARKYREKGWLRTTIEHNYLTWKQAAPQWVRLFRNRFEAKQQRRGIHRSEK